MRVNAQQSIFVNLLPRRMRDLIAFVERIVKLGEGARHPPHHYIYENDQ